MQVSRARSWRHLLRVAVLPLIATVVAIALDAQPFSAASSLAGNLESSLTARDQLLQLETEVQEFAAKEQLILTEFLARCEEFVPSHDPTSRLYEIVDQAARSAEVEILSCVVGGSLPRQHESSRSRESDPGHQELTIEISACAEVSSIDPFLQALSSAELLLIPAMVELQRADERFPQVFCRVTARAYATAPTGSDQRKGP
ncbi:MAG: hypothetical protein AB1486_17600 [Planctomycetota bacterium]